MYSAHVKQLGMCLSGLVNSTHLRNRIIATCKHIKKVGTSFLCLVMMLHGVAMRKAVEFDADTDAIHLARAATIVRRKIFNHKTCFRVAFDSHCQEQSVPNSLVALVSMVLYGPNIKTQSRHATIYTKQLSQLLMFNSFASCRVDSSHKIKYTYMYV